MNNNAEPDAIIADTPSFLASLRRVVLGAQAISLLLLMAAVVVGIGLWNDRLAQRDGDERAQDMSADWQHQLEDEIRLLSTTLIALAEDKRLQSLFLARDRAGLLEATRDIFSQLNRQAQISHLYFIEPNRNAFLRSHQPDRQGDHINRQTLLNAESSGKIESGLEIGLLGTFTLRTVLPWQRDGQRIGFLELGLEISQIISRLHLMQRTNALLFLRKDYLKRELWQGGTGAPEKLSDWDHFPGVVFSAGTDIPDRVIELIGQYLDKTGPITLRPDGRVLLAQALPIADIDQRPVGILVVMTDHTETQASAMRTTINLVLVTLMIGCTVFLVFWGVLDRFEFVYVSSERERRRFESLSMRDGLTEVYNRRAFDLILEQQKALSTLTATPLALLMLDIDHFKVVNDTYGHPVGDRVLNHVAYIIRRALRTSDTVARYGGEEFAVIMPGVSLGEARLVAERIRRSIAEQPITVVGSDPPLLYVTISIGVSALSDHTGDARQMLAQADRALYRAKQQGRNQVCDS